MEILNEDCYKGIMEWLPDGSGFVILNKKRCQKEVLPLYFKLTKYSSFTRRLNRWNFMLRKHGHSKALYFHPFFTMTDPQLCLKMRPKPQKNYSRAGKARAAKRKFSNKKCKKGGRACVSSIGTGTVDNATPQRQRDLKSLPQDLLEQKCYNLNTNSYAHSNDGSQETIDNGSTVMIGNTNYCSRGPYLGRDMTPFVMTNLVVMHHVGSQGAAAILQDSKRNQNAYSCSHVPPPSTSTFGMGGYNFLEETTREGRVLQQQCQNQHQHQHHFSHFIAAAWK